MTAASRAAVLAPLLTDPNVSGVFSDFDGTLAPIVDDPPDARPLDAAVEALAAVARKLRVAGVISGRPGAFLQEHLGGRGISLWGLYGLERVEGDEVVATPEAEEWRPAVEEVAARADEELGTVLGVERKGLAVVLHYRRAPDQGERARQWVEEAAGSTGLVVHPARMSYELRPPVRHDKGDVLEEAATGLRAVCFLGDDRGDLSAFDALDRLADRGVASVRVAVCSAEVPGELIERADLVVDGPEEVAEVLRLLADG